MGFDLLDEAAELLEKANANLEPDLLTGEKARELLGGYARIERLAAFGRTVLARKVCDAHEVARMTGTSVGKARETVDTGKRLRDSEEVGSALKAGDISFDQAAEIAKAEEARPGSAEELISVAKDEAFHVLRDKARKIKLEAEQHRDLGARQHAARSARSFTDELGMIDIHLRLEPHVGTRSSSGPRPRPTAATAEPRKRAPRSPSNAISVTPTRPCSRALRSRAPPAAPSSSCS